MMGHPDTSNKKNIEKREHGLSNIRRALVEDTLRRHKAAFDRLSKR